ncbi:MAG: hypothetical protein O7F70_08160 [Gemmatimonadetes bacterium]|nr:hypothetical protein [Gemmatimonadota bacterium]
MFRSATAFLVASCLLPTFTHAQDRVVYRIAVSGSVEVDLSDLIGSTLQAAAGEPGSIVVLDIGASGGRIDIAQLIVSHLQQATVPIYALINQNAWQAAALIALAADSIFVTAEASIGAGDPGKADQLELPATALRTIRQQFGALAARQGVDAAIGEAMVDHDVSVRGVVRRGELLTLDADAAVDVGLAAGHVVDWDDMLTVLKVIDPSVRLVRPGSAVATGTTVEIVNYHLSNVRVVLVRGGGVRYRLGIVTTNGSSSFEVSESILPAGATIQLVAEVIGGSDRVETEEIRVRPGLVIQWTIETRLSQSNLFHFVR